jgi:hypothetical protein
MRPMSAASLPKRSSIKPVAFASPVPIGRQPSLIAMACAEPTRLGNVFAADFTELYRDFGSVTTAANHKKKSTLALRAGENVENEAQVGAAALLLALGLPGPAGPRRLAGDLH